LIHKHRWTLIGRFPQWTQNVRIYLFSNFVLVVFYLFQLWKVSAVARKNGLWKKRRKREKQSSKCIFSFKFHLSPPYCIFLFCCLYFSHILFVRTWGKQTLTAQLFSTRCFVLNWWALNCWASCPPLFVIIPTPSGLIAPLPSVLPSSFLQFIHNQGC